VGFYRILLALVLPFFSFQALGAATVTFTSRVSPDKGNPRILVEVFSSGLAGQSGQVNFGASWQVTQNGSSVSEGATFDSVSFPGGGSSSVNANFVALDFKSTTTITSSGLIATLSFTPKVSSGVFRFTPDSSGVFVNAGATIGYQTTVAPSDLSFSFSNWNKTLTIPYPIGGVVTSSPSGINCGSICSSSFVLGTQVTLSATPSSGYSFAGWTNSSTLSCFFGKFDCIVTMSADQTVTATFTKNATPAPTPIPTPSASAGVCGTSHNIATANVPNTLAQLCAVGSPQFQGQQAEGNISRWICLGNGGSSAECSTLPYYPSPNSTLSVVIPLSSGTVTSSPQGISCTSATDVLETCGSAISSGCGVTCNYSFTKNQSVTLRAIPLHGRSFNGWSGGCTGKKSTCKVKLAKNKTVTAKFK